MSLRVMLGHKQGETRVAISLTYNIKIKLSDNGYTGQISIPNRLDSQFLIPDARGNFPAGRLECDQTSQSTRRGDLSPSVDSHPSRVTRATFY